MKTIRPLVPVFVMVSLGALVLSCGSFSSGGSGGSGGGSGSGVAPTGSGGTSVSGSGGTSVSGSGGASVSGSGGSGGSSSCASGTLACNGACITPTTDNTNCGACGNACASDKTCQSGSCACTTGRVLCAGSTTCIDTTSDSANCGSCGKACTASQVCSNGMCATTCTTGQTACSGACVNLQTDIAHCGTCTTACSAANNLTCTAGACVCVTGQISCSGTCKNLQTDAANCGACGMACASGQSCTAGACACAAGQTSCSGACKNLQTDAANCGTCGKACASGQTCTAGACTVGTVPGVCDILATAGNPCVAAHSTVRALYGAYTGNLYQVCKGSFVPGPNSCKGTTMDIGVVAGGYANAAAQDMFCSGGSCTISIVYDQSANANHLKPAPTGGGAVGSADNPANAADLPTTLNTHKVYGISIKTGMGYRAGCMGCGVAKATGTATGDAAETEYMVTSQNGKQEPAGPEGCCFDYGNAETDLHDDGAATMEAVYFGGGVAWGTGSPGGHANGPWVMADLENGLFAGWQNNQNQNISTNTPLKDNFVTAVVVGDVASQNSGKGRFALYGGNAQTGPLTTMWDGIRPTGYVPMKKQGSIILGTGGYNSDSGTGQWFEGVMASGAATLATCSAIQANIVAAGYGK
jgi:hypothetical protein